MLRILTYHRIAGAAETPHLHPGLISASPGAFERQMRWLARNFDVLSVGDLLQVMNGGMRLPRQAAVVTFDDAYLDFAQHAWPVLRAYAVPVTLFVPTAFPDQPQRRFWWDRLYSAFQRTDAAELQLGDATFSFRGLEERAVALKRLQKHIKALPHGEAMAAVDRVCAQFGEDSPSGNHVLGWNALRQLAAEGVTLAAHGRTHALLDRLSPDEARAEIAGAQGDLRSRIGEAPPVFCYPGGGHDSETLRILAEEGFRLGFSTLDGHNRDLSDPLRLRRTNITPRTNLPILRARMTALGGFLDRWRHRARVATPAMPQASGPRVAYIMSRFPKLTETFILSEILEQQRQGLPVEIFPLLREKAEVMHPEVTALTARARFYPFISPAIVRDNLHFLRRAPLRYLRTWAEVLRGTFGSANFFFGALGIFPKCASMSRAMQRDGISHVHAHFASHPALAGLIIQRLAGIPFSFTAHGSDLHVERRMLPQKVSAARFVVAISEFNRQVIRETCGPEAASKIRVIHCGIDPERFQPGLRAGSGPLRIVSVGSLEEVKGHEFLIRACARLKDAGREFTCHIFGEGPQRAVLEGLIREHQLQECVTLAGGRPRPEIVSALQAADVMVLASVPTARGKREGIPVSLMEAMACGLPVVSSRLSGIPELVEDGVTGFLCAPRDVDSLASALEALVAEPELRRRMGLAGRARVMRDFHLARCTAQLAALFLEENARAEHAQSAVPALAARLV